VVVLEEARQWGFLGSGPVTRHIAHARGFLAACEASAGETIPDPVLDLGSGGGVPGLVLAALLPEHRVVLLDANHRRTEFLREAVEGLGWSSRVRVLRGRAEEAGRMSDLRGSFAWVTARSFATPPVTAECAAPLLSEGGILVVSEPPPETPGAPRPAFPADASDTVIPGRGVTIDGNDERRWPEAILRRELGLTPVGTAVGEFRFAVLRQGEQCPDRYPRRVGIPEKRPLYRVLAAG
jgi:16S rRNA (guanine527-N7)-methyltransferase